MEEIINGLYTYVCIGCIGHGEPTLALTVNNSNGEATQMGPKAHLYKKVLSKLFQLYLINKNQRTKWLLLLSSQLTGFQVKLLQVVHDTHPQTDTG